MIKRANQLGLSSWLSSYQARPCYGDGLAARIANLGVKGVRVRPIYSQAIAHRRGRRRLEVVKTAQMQPGSVGACFLAWFSLV